MKKQNIEATHYLIATFGERLSAWAIDALAFASWIIVGLGAASLVFATQIFLLQLGDLSTITLAVTLTLPMILVIFLPSVIFLLGNMASTANKGYSFGQKMVGLRIVLKDKGTNIGWKNAFIRYMLLCSFWIFALVPVIGIVFILGSYLTMFSDKNKLNRTWHDKAGKNVIISIKKPVLPIQEIPQNITSI